MKIMIRTAAALAGMLLASAAFAAPPPAIYTAAQATAGATVYATNCAICHGADLKGGAGPALLGQAFANASGNTSLGAIFSMAAQQMPAGNPGSLTHDQYTQVMAYILNKNGYPAGGMPLDYTASLTSTVPLVSQVP